MENYIVSARKYRPSTFASVVGQKALTTTLKNAVATNRLAHSYLFCGPRGVGKTSCARIFAKTINCTNRGADGEACNECESCRDFNNGTSLNIIELDAASNNGVDDIRTLTDQVMMPPASGRYRVFIIDEVHMLSTAAFNAFLKTLEEPPSYVIFILATTEKHKIIPTILSRCQTYDFHRITIQDMIEHLQYVAGQEGIVAEEAALNVIARKADGAMRDALSIFDQVAASSNGNITYQTAIDNLNVLDTDIYSRLTECMLSADITGAWVIYQQIREKGFDSQFFINGLAQYLRDLMVSRSPDTISLVEAGDEARKVMAATAAKCSPEWLYRALCLCNDADLNYRISSSKQLLIEITLAKICQLSAPTPATDTNTVAIKPISAASAPTQAPQAPKATATVPPVQTTPRNIAPQAAPPRPGARPTQGATRISISTRPRSSEPHAAAQRPDAGQNTPSEQPPADIDPDALRQAWEDFIIANPREHLLINTMRLCPPLADPAGRKGVFRINLTTEAALNTVTDAMPQIKQYITERLGGSPIFETAVVATEVPHTRSDREVLKHLYETHPMVRQFVDTLSLKLD